MKNQLSETRNSQWIARFTAALLLFAIANVQAQENCISAAAGFGQSREFDGVLTHFGSRLIAVGRVDSVSSAGEVEILGYSVQSNAGESFQVGDYAAIVDWSRRGSRERLLEAHGLASRYVPGASEVYLKSRVAAVDAAHGRASLNNIEVDYSATSLVRGEFSGLVNSVITVRGIQPNPRGVVLGSCATATLDSFATSRRIRPDGSMGTGSPDGSMGTGSPDGSMGTGSPDGSMGTGSPDGSMGTGSPDGSMGTGSPDGSMGTGSSTS